MERLKSAKGGQPKGAIGKPQNSAIFSEGDKGCHPSDPLSISDRIQAVWTMAKDNPVTERPKADASPYGQYAKQERTCSVCGSKRLVKDGRYFCRKHHPEGQA